ncbi:MAG TPA: hypothetical protein PLN85_00495 [archaeon]|nr:hypothetical protein [archaeon]
MNIINIIREEIESIYSANFPEFGDRLHHLDLDNITEELESIVEYGEATHEPYPFKFDNVSFNEVNYHFDTEEDEYVVLINLVDRISRKWEVSFGVVGGTPTDILNKGRHFRVMSTITKIINDFIDKYKPNFILIKPSKNDEYEDLYNREDKRRFNMYMAYVKKNMRPDYFAYEYTPYIVIERKVKIKDDNIVTI